MNTARTGRCEGPARNDADLPSGINSSISKEKAGLMPAFARPVQDRRDATVTPDSTPTQWTLMGSRLCSQALAIAASRESVRRMGVPSAPSRAKSSSPG